MARQESDREDLMAEATALRPRLEFLLDCEADELVAGRRIDGGWSIYFGADPVFHFDEDGRLRRSFCQGKLLRTQGTTLAELTRERTDRDSQLHRRNLSPTELLEFLDRMQNRLAGILHGLEAGSVRVLRCVADVSPPIVLDELRQFLHRVIEGGPELAPSIPGKR